jgi:hypothetical protein
MASFQVVPTPAMLNAQEIAAHLTTAAVYLTLATALLAKCAMMEAAMANKHVMVQLSHRW